MDFYSLLSPPPPFFFPKCYQHGVYRSRTTNQTNEQKITKGMLKTTIICVILLSRWGKGAFSRPGFWDSPGLRVFQLRLRSVQLSAPTAVNIGSVPVGQPGIAGGGVRGSVCAGRRAHRCAGLLWRPGGADSLQLARLRQALLPHTCSARRSTCGGYEEVSF